MHNQSHPDLEQLDLLRAGLLDDTPDKKRALQQHLASCPDCSAQQDQWQLFGTAMADSLRPEAVQLALHQARRTAMSAAPATQRRPFAVMATAALLLITVTVGMLALESGNQTPAPVTQTAQSIPDTYEDLDFYLWLATQDDHRSDRGDDNRKSS